MNLKNSHIIHIFALLHVAVALSCRATGVADEIWLTLLSVAMVSLICVRAKVRIELTVSAIILANVAGYLLGVYGARLLALLSDSTLLTHSVSTFLTTETIGWCTTLLLKASIRKKAGIPAHNLPPPARKIGKKHVILLVGIIFLILTVRMLMYELFTYSSGYRIYDILDLLLSRSWMTVVMLCLLILLVRLIRKLDWNTAAKSALVVCTCLFLALVTVFYIYIDPPAGVDREFSRLETAQIFTVSATAVLTGFSIVYIIYYAIRLKSEIRAEREKAAIAEFQYARLKQQVNPHFLFNSLNILDCLVSDGKSVQASTYIHKLAGIYRYMLKYDDRTTVTLEDEMNFVGMYVDLLKVRFDDGFSVNIDIPDSMMPLHVIPCSVQMLIENAIKHNRLGKDCPLDIDIYAGTSGLTVENRIRPKVTAGESTKIGLSYLKRQYGSLFGKEVSVTTDNGIFSVTVPLLPPGSGTQHDGGNSAENTVSHITISKS